MSHAVAYVFVKDLFPESTEIAVSLHLHVKKKWFCNPETILKLLTIINWTLQTRQMIKNIQLEMESRINNSNWLDETSKTIIKDKLNSMRFFLGFPDWYKNETAVINYYKGVRNYYKVQDSTYYYSYYSYYYIFICIIKLNAAVHFFNHLFLMLFA